MKQRDPAHDVTVIERDGPDDTFGWGIVFSDQTFAYLRESDAPSFEAITAACETWDNVDIVHRGERITIRGNRFSGIARIAFLQRAAGALRRARRRPAVPPPGRRPRRSCRRTICWSAPTAPTAWSAARMSALFQPTVAHGRNKYIWLGTPRLFHGLTLTFVEHAAGLFAAHSYKFDRHDQHLHRRVQRGDVAGRRPRRDERGGDLRLPGDGVRRRTSTASRC